MKRPRNLLFARDEQPPASAVFLLGAQHAAISVVFLVYAAMIGKGAGLSQADQQSLLVGTLMACGIGALIQSGLPRLSSGLLVVPISAAGAVIFGIDAGKAAGPAGIAALPLIGGAIQLLVGRSISRLRAYFPPEVCGVVVLMLGVSMLPRAVNYMLGGNAADPGFKLSTTALVISLVTMGTIMISSVWLKGMPRFFAMLIGCLAGYAASGFFGEMQSLSGAISSSALIGMPTFRLPSFSLETSFLLGFMVLVLVGILDNMGVMISTDRLDNADWSKPDTRQLSRGITSIGGTNILSSILGGTQLGFSATNIGLAFATGVTSRHVGSAAGVIMIIASFFPKLVAPLAAMPEPVLGGILGYATSFFIVSGASLALSRMMSTRRMLVIGIPIAAGIALQVAPAISNGSTGVAAVILHSPLIFASLLAISLNAVMRIGIAQRATLPISGAADQHDLLRDALEHWGETWGLKQHTVSQADSAVNQLLEAVSDLNEGTVAVELRHDEVSLVVSVSYTGMPIIFPERAPTPDELMDSPDGVSRMAGWIIRKLADKAQQYSRDGKQFVTLRFET